MVAAPVSSTRANSYLVHSRSPVATGMLVWRATSAISSGRSGGVGSSNHSGSYFSMRRAMRLAPDTVYWPCVPKSRSALSPTASRISLQKRSAMSRRSSVGWRGSNTEYPPTGSNFTAVKPCLT